jgi:hypothetical protein
MSVVMGPVLAFRGLRGTSWDISVLVVVDDDGAMPLEWGTDAGRAHRTTTEAVLLHEVDRFRVLRFDLSVTLRAAAQQVTYAVGGIEERFTVPRDGQPPDCAYTSCNGFSNPRDMKKVADKNERWRHLAGKQAESPMHLLLMGGDQVYSDSIWETVPAFKKWSGSNARKRRAAAFTPEMQAAADAFYFNLYVDRWRQPEPRQALARIPTVMMWDDHDIFDGWGSYPPEDQASAVYQGIFEVARKYFRIFQLQLAPGESHPFTLPGQTAFSYCYQFGSVALAVLDMRSDRSQSQVLSETSWTPFYDWLDGLKGCTHLLLMSSIPVVHPDFGAIERILGIFPGQQELEDDLKDHWLSRTHKTERLRLIHRLLNYARERACRVTILSGDVHVGAIGVIESTRTNDAPENSQVINQLTSSGIVHPSPPGMMLHFLESLGDNVLEVDRGITTRMLAFPGTRNRFIGTRNWLELQHDDQDRIWACWHVPTEDPQTAKKTPAPLAPGEKPYTKVIHPCAKAAAGPA